MIQGGQEPKGFLAALGLLSRCRCLEISCEVAGYQPILFGTRNRSGPSVPADVFSPDEHEPGNGPVPFVLDA